MEVRLSLDGVGSRLGLEGRRHLEAIKHNREVQQQRF